MEKTRIIMDWSDLNFKAKDLILLSMYIISGVFFISKITNSIERLNDKTTELQQQIVQMQNDDKGSTKENQAFLQSIQNQVNVTNTQLRLLEQRVEMLENLK